MPKSLLTTDDVEAERSRRFWMGQLYAALVGYVAAAPAVLSYVALTWTQSNRGWMVVVVAVALTLSLCGYLLRHRLVNARHRVWLFASWNTIGFAFVLLLCMLDSGINSPITYLYVVPMLYLGIGFPLRAVVACGLFGLAGCVLLIGLNEGVVYGQTNMLQFMTLSIGWLVAIVSALNRARQDRALYQLRQRLEILAATDELTGCLNQRAFAVAVRQEVARSVRYRHELALLLIDVDHFKQVNDRHGHLVGDAVLRQVGAALRQTARDTDVTGRPGGDELALLAPETDGAAAGALAERLRQQLKAHSAAVDITLSIGICTAGPDTESATTLFRRADQALYRAKRHGRDRVAIYEDGDAANPDEYYEQMS